MATEILSEVSYRDIDGFPGYRIGSDGSVWSCRPLNGQGGLKSEWRLLKQDRSTNGYMKVRISPSPGERQVPKSVHRLVASAFHEKPDGSDVVRHLNGIKSDNRAANLAWGTIFENAADSIKHGVQIRGDTHHATKFSESEVVQLRIAVANGANAANLAKRHGVNVSVIYRICSGIGYAHVGGPRTIRSRQFCAAKPPRGSNSASAKLTDLQRQQIVIAMQSGERSRDVAKRFGVCFGTVCKIVKLSRAS